jgi:hypothetical protein
LAASSNGCRDDTASLQKMVANLRNSPAAVDADMRRLIRRYGAKDVQEAMKRETARPRGRSPRADWPELHRVLREDASLWLQGGDPFATRSNLSIARGFADRHRGHSYDATRDRIMRKLRERRRYYTIVEAEWLSQNEFPYTENLRAIRTLLNIGIRRDLWGSLLRLHEGYLADYREKFGEPPAGITMQKLLSEAATLIAPEPRFGPGNILQIVMSTQPK